MATVSPLTQQARPTFQPKIVSLYKLLFREEDNAGKSEGYWTEFFLLKAYAPGMQQVLEPLSSEDLLHMQPQTRELFSRAVGVIKAGNSPADEHALDTLSIFLRELLAKRYTNLSSDIISLLTGLDNVDAVFTDFVGSLDNIIKNGRTVEQRRKAIHLALTLACGAFQTGLLSYFTHRDFFPALMKFTNDPDTNGLEFEPFLLLGILANYNKFEMQNPYQLRLDDFVNESAMKRIVQQLGKTCTSLRADYVAIHDDIPEGWSLNSMLSYVGLTVLQGGKGKPATPTEPVVDGSKLSFTTLPGAKAAVFLATYDFVHANKLFSYNLVNYKDPSSQTEPPISSFISITSYLVQHAHRSPRAAMYGRVNLTILRILLEDEGICKRLISDETKAPVRLCRQRQPYLPIVRGDRVLLTAILDLITDGISHNLRKKLDVELYIANFTVLSRIISFLARTRTRLTYHWEELWRSLLSFLRFLASYPAELDTLSNIQQVLEQLVSILARSLSDGESFLPTTAAYDDLFYKLIENGDQLIKFRDAYHLDKKGLAAAHIKTLLKVTEHYASLIEENKSKMGKKSLSPEQVSEIIKKGYESLELNADGSSGVNKAQEERYREAGERSFLKQIARMAVKDAKDLVSSSSPSTSGSPPGTPDVSG
ncbi:DUF1741-domain-containing protein [Ascobolus immersus RN42]|uniref:DUF1741-domain-containing protein n=1 Tax=Ascobolus immersus RN42 TaxID=1160509 RepID=A0A3N4IMB1_ASCIM|nr:DUF1741-domain-containing protein [Ascobolus immersus RN42]